MKQVTNNAIKGIFWVVFLAVIFPFATSAYHTGIAGSQTITSISSPVPNGSYPSSSNTDFSGTWDTVVLPGACSWLDPDRYYLRVWVDGALVSTYSLTNPPVWSLGGTFSIPLGILPAGTHTLTFQVLVICGDIFGSGVSSVAYNYTPYSFTTSNTPAAPTVPAVSFTLNGGTAPISVFHNNNFNYSIITTPRAGQCQYRHEVGGTIVTDWTDFNCIFAEFDQTTQPASFPGLTLSPFAVPTRANLTSSSGGTLNTIKVRARLDAASPWSSEIMRQITDLSGPQAAIITGPLYLKTGQTGVFSVVSPENPPLQNVRYEFSWDNPLFVSGYLPSASTYAKSDIPQTVSNSWPSTGSHSLWVRVISSSGAISSYSMFTVTITNNSPPSDPIIIGPDVVPAGSYQYYNIVSTDPEGSTVTYRYDASNLNVLPDYNNDANTRNVLGYSGTNFFPSGQQQTVRLYFNSANQSGRIGFSAMDNPGILSNIAYKNVAITRRVQITINYLGRGSFQIVGGNPSPVGTCSGTYMGTCFYTVDEAASISVVPLPGAGYTFHKWKPASGSYLSMSGCSDTASANCTVTVLNPGITLNPVFLQDPQITVNSPIASGGTANVATSVIMDNLSGCEVANSSGFSTWNGNITSLGTWNIAANTFSYAKSILPMVGDTVFSVRCWQNFGGPFYTPWKDATAIVPSAQNGTCNAATNNKKIVAVPNEAARCSVGVSTNFQTTATGWKWKCDNSANGGGVSVMCNATRLQVDVKEQ